MELAADTARLADTAQAAEGTVRLAGPAQVAADTAVAAPVADTGAAAGMEVAGRTQAPKTAPRRVGELLTLISASCEWL